MSPEVKKITVICASVYKPGKPGWWDLEQYSFWLRHTWAAGNTGRGHTSTWHFENPNHARRPNIHKYSKLLVSIEILEPVFFVSWNEPSNCFQISDCYTSGIAAVMTLYPIFCGSSGTRRQSLTGTVPISTAIQLILKFTINHCCALIILIYSSVHICYNSKRDTTGQIALRYYHKIQRQTHN